MAEHEAAALIRHLQDEADVLQELVVAYDTKVGWGDVAPPELVNLFGALVALARFGAMLQAQVCDALTNIATQAGT